MVTLIIHGVPPELHRSLLRRAEENARSLDEEVLSDLVELDREKTQKLFGQDREAEVFRMIAAVRENILQPLSAEEVRVGIEEGRS